jgi:hypothetical protein
VIYFIGVSSSITEPEEIDGVSDIEEWITSRWALYNKAWRSAPEKPSVLDAISSKSIVGETVIFLATAIKI